MADKLPDIDLRIKPDGEVRMGDCNLKYWLQWYVEVRREMAKKGIETQWTYEPVCPYCGTAEEDWWDGLSPNARDGYEFEIDCGECEKVYKATMHISTDFCTKKIVKPDPEEMKRKGFINNGEGSWIKEES